MLSLNSLPTRPLKFNRSRGLTLMELVVVMTVLAALAAILIPLLPNLLRRSHKVVETTQTSEISKAIQLYQGAYLSYPNEWDLMTAGSATPPTFLPADGGNTFGGAATVGNLTADEVAALGRVGITTGHDFVASLGSSNHPTENPYANPVTSPTAIGTSTNVFLITAATAATAPIEIQNIVARDGSARFVVFGVGQRSSMVGKVMQNAPVLTPSGGNMTPSTVYARYGAVFQVAGLGVNTTERARFVGAVILEDDAIEGGEHAMIGYYDVSNSGE